MEQSRFCDVNMLYRPFIRILKINLTDESFTILKIREEEKEEAFWYSECLSGWFRSFAQKGGVAQEDRRKYEEETSIQKLREHFEKGNQNRSIRYRRREKEGFLWAEMEFVRACEYETARPYVYMYEKLLGEMESPLEGLENKFDKKWGFVKGVKKHIFFCGMLLFLAGATHFFVHRAAFVPASMDSGLIFGECGTGILLLLFLSQAFFLIRKLLKRLFFLEKSLKAAWEEIENHHKKEIEFIYMSETDCLTGIANRRAQYRIQELMDAGVFGMFCLLDADKFKHINDAFGHQTGDKVLRAIADCLRLSFRKEDVIFRLGGDEFGVYVRGVLRKEEGQRLIDRFFEEIEKLVIPEMKGEKFHLSMGAAFYTGNEKFPQLYGRADKGCYQSKEREENCCTFTA